ncbi:hypothetical protein [Shouchella clausii]|uniref:hypothetical protein n=1 Tax=Shouchella clausii TaxID=79880 RepID=UPI001C73AD41|nr:hypothetical protein [Shouchella clausii]MBX0320203.1 hypothetical protein [Shouchella clausii]MEB5480782.1 hypothetical protein [Shouchella clausii]
MGQQKPTWIKRITGFILHYFNSLYNILTAVNIVWFIYRLIDQRFWLSIVAKVEFSDPSIGGLATYIFQDTFFQVVLLHTIIQLFLGIMFLLLPITYFKIEKLVLPGGTTLEAERKIQEGTDSVASKQQYLTTLLSTEFKEREMPFVGEADTLEQYARGLFYRCQNDLYANFNRDFSIVIYNTEQALSDLDEETRIYMKEAEQNGIAKRPISPLKEKQGYSHRIFLYRESYLDQHDFIHVIIESEHPFDASDYILIEGIFNYSVFIYDYITLSHSALDIESQ